MSNAEDLILTSSGLQWAVKTTAAAPTHNHLTGGEVTDERREYRSEWPCRPRNLLVVFFFLSPSLRKAEFMVFEPLKQPRPPSAERLMDVSLNAAPELHLLFVWRLENKH